MTGIPAEKAHSRKVPRGRTAYLHVLERLPPDRQDRLRSAATSLRRAKTAVRLFRERWVRRARRSVRRSQRRWTRLQRRCAWTLRRLQRKLLRVLRHLRQIVRPYVIRLRHQVIDRELPAQSQTEMPDHDVDSALFSPGARMVYRPRSALTRRLFPPTVPLPGTGDVVLVNAVGRTISDVLERAETFGERWIVATDDPDVGPLREADIIYEYLPADFEGGLAARICWLDYVYGIEAIVGIDEVPLGRGSLSEPVDTLAAMPTQEARSSQNTTGQNTGGWRAVFSLAPVYRFAQTAIGADRVRTVLAEEFIRATSDDRIVDFGCGTADILDYLPECDYVGVDSSEGYIDDARSRFGDRGTFVASAAERFDSVAPDRTIAIAIGVLHHLDDGAAAKMLQVASTTLEGGGRFVSIDPSLVHGQHPIAKLLVSRDRGRHVRTPEAQTELVRRWFPDADIVVRHDLLRTPYSHVIVSATTQRS